MTVGYDEFVVRIKLLRRKTKMKSLFELNSGTYRKQSDYLFPNLTFPKSEEKAIGIYGQRHLNFFTGAPQIDLYQFTYKRRA